MNDSQSLNYDVEKFTDDPGNSYRNTFKREIVQHEMDLIWPLFFLPY